MGGTRDTHLNKLRVLPPLCRPHRGSKDLGGDWVLLCDTQVHTFGTYEHIQRSRHWEYSPLIHILYTRLLSTFYTRDQRGPRSPSRDLPLAWLREPRVILFPMCHLVGTLQLTSVLEITLASPFSSCPLFSLAAHVYQCFYQRRAKEKRK